MIIETEFKMTTVCESGIEELKRISNNIETIDNENLKSQILVGCSPVYKFHIETTSEELAREELERLETDMECVIDTSHTTFEITNPYNIIRNLGSSMIIITPDDLQKHMNTES